MKEEFTRKQMELWGNTNMLIGATVITVVHFIALLLGTTPLNWFWQGVLLLVLVLVGMLYYRKYQQTKEKEE